MTFNTKILAGALALVLVAGMTSPAFAGIVPVTECKITQNQTVKIEINAKEEVEILKTIECNGPLISASYSSDTCEKNFIFPVFDLPAEGNTATFTESITNEGDISSEHCIVVWEAAAIDGELIFVTQELWINMDKQVAGELVPLDSTALLIGGLSSMSAFMIPAVAGLVGAGIYLVKFRAKE